MQRPARATHPAAHEVADAARPQSDVLAEALRHLGAANVTGHPGEPWCQYFVNMVARRTGHYAPASGMAYAARTMGAPTAPHPGAVAYSSWHSGIVLSVRGDRVTLVAGNNHAGRVGVSHFATAQFRYVDPYPLTRLADAARQRSGRRVE